ncbi:hypothetical protein DPMN_073028 [Dreissena polymorpha]|uniref:Uncharacterized protein n=1 Tax=Dreissena polymorpha TaxID=45954 RepID=A0A9D4BYA7_DREPO|nr:hypothetical protein DPMN_073028 [Dreissena polymorpha]
MSPMHTWILPKHHLRSPGIRPQTKTYYIDPGAILDIPINFGATPAILNLCIRTPIGTASSTSSVNLAQFSWAF